MARRPDGRLAAGEGRPDHDGLPDPSDLPFYYALADAHTIGDAYHCSVLAATGPNRAYLWSGSINADQEHGPFVAHAAADYLGDFLPWECYPVTLQRAGLSWRVYQGSDNYGDNGAQYFATLAELDPAQGGAAPAPGASVYYDNGLAVVPEPLDFEAGNADNLARAIAADVRAGTLPQVSWVVTNQRYSEHPNGAATDGEYYVGRVLQALSADPDVFNSTLVIINYDENDGQFDHVPPPVPVPGTAGESYLTAPLAPTPLPAGLGFRVPLLLVSPWTRGGWVTSEVCDHTSVLQFLERWTTAIGAPAICPNISGWRRGVCGDLMAAFDFEHPVDGLPDLPFVAAPVGDAHEYHPVPAGNAMPAQEPGVRPARPLPVQPNASLTGFAAVGGAVTAELALSNGGGHVIKASHFSVYDNTLTAAPSMAEFPARFPGQYTVAPTRRIGAATVATGPVGADGGYDITVIGPNRFLRRFAGNVTTAGATAQVTADYRGRRPSPGAHADARQRRDLGRDVHGDARPLSGRSGRVVLRPGRTAGRLPARPADDRRRLVRPDPDDRRRRLLVTAVHRSPGVRPAQRHRLTAARWSSRRRRRPDRTRSSMMVSVQYQVQENQRRGSCSGATTAARTAVTTRSANASAGSAVLAGPR